MSLIRVRRERKRQTGLDVKRARSTGALVVLLAVVVLLIWLLSRVS